MKTKTAVIKTVLLALSFIFIVLVPARAEYEYKNVECGDAVIHSFKIYVNGDCGATITKIVKNGTGSADVGYSGGSCCYNPNYHLPAGGHIWTEIYFAVDENAPDGAILRSTASYELVLDNANCNSSGAQSSSAFSKVKIGVSKTKREEKAFITALNSEKWETRAEAAKALGRIKSKEAVVPLIQLLKDKKRNVRFEAVWALGRIKSRKAVEFLTSALNDEDNGVRWAAEKALEKITK
ncbi:MAG: HEAT repeat domain-containing protein [bacterium]|nr:HEAT repeat domain-containing protein [bacterium]